jgi:hypothetical protein
MCTHICMCVWMNIPVCWGQLMYVGIYECMIVCTYVRMNSPTCPVAVSVRQSHCLHSISQHETGTCASRHCTNPHLANTCTCMSYLSVVNHISALQNTVNGCRGHSCLEQLALQFPDGAVTCLLLLLQLCNMHAHVYVCMY